MRHTRRIATHGQSPQGHDPRAHPGPDQQITGSLERVSASGGLDSEIAAVRSAAFPLALRGYEREAVDAYVARVNRLVADLEASRSPDAAIRRALDRVGEETSSILQRAQETANEITERSRASADDRVREAEREASDMTADAEDRVRELEADYGEIWARRDRLLDEVRDLAERLLATADDAAERYPTQEEADGTYEDTASFTPVAAAVESPAPPFGVNAEYDFDDECEDALVTTGEADADGVAPAELEPAHDVDPHPIAGSREAKAERGSEAPETAPDLDFAASDEHAGEEDPHSHSRAGEGNAP